MKKCFLLFIVLMVFTIHDHIAQQLTPYVISTSGGFSSNSSGMLSFTTGEMSAVETYSTSFSILTQGFQQAWDFSTAVHDFPLAGFSFEAYPNPSGGYLQLVSKSEEDYQITIRIMDLLGKEIFDLKYTPMKGVHIEPLDLNHLPQGMYLVSIHVTDQTTHDAFQFVEKINIVR